ncbi:MAG TPA: chemotaxis protein CheW [Planctomycetota bacterium]|nr:chemotaxis protein CheW [Planctomycetota bacterium]
MERSTASAQTSALSASSESTSESAERNGPCLLARAAGRLCALPLANVFEVMRPLPIEPFPAMPPSVLGLSTIRGTPLPVVDLAQLVEPRPPVSGDASHGAPETRLTLSGRRFITIRTNDASRIFALSVEAIERVGQLSGAAWESLPPLLNAGHSETIDAIGTLDMRVLLLLKASRLIDDQTWNSIEKERRA